VVVDVSMELVSSVSGEVLSEKKAWWSLGSPRLRSFVGARCRDRAALACGTVEPSFPTLRLEAYKRPRSVKKTSSFFEYLASSTTARKDEERRFVATCDVTPWLELRGSREGKYRWVRLSTGAAAGKRRKAAQASPRRRELCVLATVKLGDEVAPFADAVPTWFYEPARRAPTLVPNVARVAVVRASGVPEQCYVAARCVSERNKDAEVIVDVPGKPRPKHLVAGATQTTRLCAGDGVWMQTLTLALADLETEDSCLVELVVLQEKSVMSLYESSAVVARAVAMHEEGQSEEAEWIETDRAGVSLRVAVKLDYDELLDPAESRPFFREEVFPALLHAPDGEDEKRPAPNAVRVVVARCRNSAGPRRGRPAQSTLAASVSHGGETKSTLAKTPALDGTAVWNECFEFLDNVEHASPVRVALSGAGAVAVDAPLETVRRRWYDVGGAQLLVAATRFYDASIDAVEQRRAATEQLALAFPDVAARDLERVYDSTNDVREACVALGALTGAAKSDDDAEPDFVAACNTTDLGWVLSPLDDAAAGDDDDDDDSAVLERRSSSFDDDDETVAKRKAAVKRNKPALFRVGTGASLLTKRQTIDLVKAQDLNDLDLAFEFKNPGKPALEVDFDPDFYEDDPVLWRQKTLNSERLPEPPDVVVDNALLRRQGTASSDNSLPSDASSAHNHRMRRMLHRGPRKAAVTVRSSIAPDAAIATSPVLKQRFENTPFDLAKLYLDVRRTPRDFVTLRAGLINKLRGVKPGDPNYHAPSTRSSPDDDLPPLPAWVRRSLNMKATQRLSTAAAAGAGAALAAALAIGTGMAPILVVSGAVALGSAAALGARKTTKAVARNAINADLAKCDWLDRVRAIIANWPASSRSHDAQIFFKLFIAHGGRIRLFQRAKDDRDRVRRSSGLLDPKALKEIADDPDASAQPLDRLPSIRASLEIHDEAKRRSLTRPTRPAPLPPTDAAVV